MTSSPKKILLARDLALPFTITTMKVALMGGNGSGKTYAAMKMLEEILEAGGWAVVLDPVGVHYGLRLDKTGKKSSGLDIPIFGGLHGDVILTPTSGKLIADLICDRRLSAILDVSQFETDADLNRFATDFGNQFWNRMKAQRRAVTLVLEECQEFIPQNPSKGEERKLHIYNRITKIGRNYGIGVMMMSARPQDINKKSLNLTQVMFAFQMTGTHERKAMEEWFTYSGFESKLGGLLPTLEVGEPWVMSPRTLKINKQIKILEKKTFDASATPDFDETDSQTISIKPLDISKLEDAMKEHIEEAKANDPVELKKELAKTRRELEKALSEQPASTQPDPIEIKSPIFEDAQYKELTGIFKRHNDKAEAIRQEIKAFSDKANAEISELITAIAQPARSIEEIRKSVNTHKTHALPPSREVRGAAVYPGTRAYRPVINPVRKTDETRGEYKTESSESINGPEQKILDALAWFESIAQVTPLKKAVAILAGYTPGAGGFNNPCGSLKRKELIGYESGSRMFLTTEGQKIATYPQGAWTKDTMQRQVLSILDGPQTRILIPLLNVWPESINKDELAQLAQYQPRSGGFNNPIGRLRTMGIVEYSGKNEARAADFLFLK